MKFLIVLAAIAAVAVAQQYEGQQQYVQQQQYAAQPQQYVQQQQYAQPQARYNADARTARILRQELNNIGVGDYSYAYETENGIAAQEVGQLTNVGTDVESIAVRGAFSYVGDDGQTYTVNYVADENGFRPEGAHLPKSA